MKTFLKILIVFLLIYVFNSSFVFTQTGNNTYSQFTESVDTTWVNHFMSNDLPGIIRIADMKTDASGNVYIVGTVRNMLSSDDYITIKYNSAGVEQWSAEYNGTANSTDIGSSIAVDASGNVFVTGGSRNFETERDYATIKYNSAGEQQWVATYDGPVTEASDQAEAICVDDSGNVYVTGGSDAFLSEDYATIKYSNDGAEQWVKRYSGPDSEGGDTGYFIQIDASGSIYVAGRSDGNNGKDDYLVVKYNSIGEEQWVSRYDGPDSKTDQVKGLVIDQAGNVYVTGQSSNANSKWEYATVMFNSAGVEQWSARYSNSTNSNDRARALAINDLGFVYVTGSSDDGSKDDFVTIKYNPTGGEEWVTIYNGPSNNYDRASVITLDESGNIFVAGESEGSTLIKYDPAGNELLTANYPDIYMVIAQSMDVAGNIIFAGNHSNSGYSATVKYSDAGIKAWDAIKNGPPLSNEQPVAMALDFTGNLYVTGNSRRAQTSVDYSLIKYNSSGDELWTAFYNGLDGSSDYVSAIVTDNVGNVYLTGQSGLPGNDKDWATIKYSPEGVEQWAVRFVGIADYHASAEDLVVDADGNVYVTGYSPKENSFNSIDITTIKYNSTGEEEWVVYYDGPAALGDYGYALVLDDVGDIYVTGSSQGISGGDDITTIKYNPAGIEQWVKRYNGDGNSADVSFDIDVDQLNNIAICGYSNGVENNPDFLTIKYNSLGEEQWVQRYNGTANKMDIPEELAINENGDVFVTGYTSGSDNDDFLTIKYSSGGVEQWASRYNGPGYNFGNSDRASALAIGDNGNIYVTGVSEGFFGSYDYATLKYNSEGSIEWITRFDFKHDTPSDVVSDGLGHIFVTGQTLFDNDSEAMATTIKYTDVVTTDINNKDKDIAVTFQLNQNYPNPFNPTTTITYQLAKSSNVDLSIYNLIGQKVATLVSEKQPAGEYQVTWDASGFSSGVYFYQIKTKNFQKTKQMLILK